MLFPSVVLNKCGKNYLFQLFLLKIEMHCTFS
jgi:hypothetical protein